MVRINTNLIAMAAERNLGIVSDELQNSTQKLSSGLRINFAKDDSAGLTISEKLRSQIRSIDQAAKNAQDGVSMIQTAEGALNEVHAMLQRMRELAVQGGNDTLNTEEREALATEMEQLIDNVDRVATTTRYDQFVMFDGSLANGLMLQIGANGGERLAVKMGDMTAQALSLDTILVDTANNSNLAIDTIDKAIDAVSAQRSELGGAQNALDTIVNTLNVASENLHGSESRVRDLDVANETVAFTKWQILQQSGTAVLAQANVFPQTVLQLLKAS